MSQLNKLENFYNEYHPRNTQIFIDGTDINHENMREMFQK